MKPKHKPFSVVLFSISIALLIYIFIALKYDTLIVDKIGSATDKNSLAVFYSVIMVILGLGVTLFAVSKAFLRSENNKTKYLPSVAAVSTFFIISISVLVYSSTLPLIVSSAFFAALNLGYFGGWMLWSLSMFLNGANYAGRIIGSCILVATIALEYFPVFIRSDTIQLLIIVLFTIASITIVNRLWQNFAPIPHNIESTEVTFNKGMLCIVTIALMTVLFGIANGLFLKVYSQDDTYTMQFYQMVHGVSAFFFGLMFDFRKKSYPLLIITLVIFAFFPLLLNYPQYRSVYGVIAWSYGGLFCLLYILPFVYIAPHSRFPEFWASVGAITRYVVTGVVIIPTALLVEFINNDTIVAINVIITAILLKIILTGRNKDALELSGSSYEELELSDSGNEEYEVNSTTLPNGNELSSINADSLINAPKNQLPHVEKFVRKYSLNQTEATALQHLISSEESLKIIARKENVSERTFQRYLTSLYEKTGTKTRAGVVTAYHKELFDVDSAT